MLDLEKVNEKPDMFESPAEALKLWLWSVLCIGLWVPIVVFAWYVLVSPL